MSVDIDVVKRMAELANVALDSGQASKIQGELDKILSFVDQLNEVNVEGVEPMTCVVDMAMRKRKDTVNDGDKADDIMVNAPESEDNFFMVPKIVE